MEKGQETIFYMDSLKIYKGKARGWCFGWVGFRLSKCTASNAASSYIDNITTPLPPRSHITSYLASVSPTTVDYD